jgi:hypothetical protein
MVILGIDEDCVPFVEIALTVAPFSTLIGDEYVVVGVPPFVEYLIVKPVVAESVTVLAVVFNTIVGTTGVTVGVGLTPLFTWSITSFNLAIIGLRLAAFSCVEPSVKYGVVNF